MTAYSNEKHHKLLEYQRTGAALASMRFPVPVPSNLQRLIVGKAYQSRNINTRYEPTIIGDLFLGATFTPGLHIQRDEHAMVLTTTIEFFAHGDLHERFLQYAKQILLSHNYYLNRRTSVVPTFTKQHVRPVAGADITSEWRAVRALCADLTRQSAALYGVTAADSVRETTHGEFITKIPRGTTLRKNGPYWSDIPLLNILKRKRPNANNTLPIQLKRPRPN